LEHNHMLVPENASFATSYQKLTTEMKELIENYVRLLRGLFPEATIVDYDMKNYVYKFRRTHDIQRCDTAKLFQHFEKEHNNFKLRIVAQAILPDETSESYRWVLQQTIKATGVQPGAFMIDADPGLESVVPEIYPDTYLLHCIWHIERNIEKQLAKLLGDHYADFIK
ncbi:9788_t:CDS:2, partial [Racocetra fulgida]